MALNTSLVSSFVFSLQWLFFREQNYRSAKRSYEEFMNIHIARTKKNILFRLPRWGSFSSHTSVGTGALFVLATVFLLVGRLDNRFFLNPFLRIFYYFLEHVYMRAEVNWNLFEISYWGIISRQCKITSLLAFTWAQAKGNSRWCRFHFGQFDWSELSICSEVPSKQ